LLDSAKYWPGYTISSAEMDLFEQYSKAKMEVTVNFTQKNTKYKKKKKKKIDRCSVPVH